jgi:predicted RNA-binding protein with PUA-like domain
MKRKYWLMKSEPSAYSISDLERENVTCWDGVRNYQARNFMRDDMQKGDGVLFYHSNIVPPGIAGEAVIAKTSYSDYTAWDPKDPHYDPKSRRERPTWFMVDVQFVRKCREIITLAQLKETDGLEGMEVVKRGSRLSVTPVSQEAWNIIMRKFR